MTDSQDNSRDLSISAADFLRKATEFTEVREMGTTVAGRFLVVSRAPAPDQRTRLGIVVSRRCCRKAVGRNRGRRLIRESFRLCRSMINGPCWLVVIARHPIVRATMPEVRDELLRLLDRLEKAELG